MSLIEFKNINKVYPNGFHAVKDFNLSIKRNEFIVFVGPSGCGKTTTLRMFAGLEEITKGELVVEDAVVNDWESKDRNIAMVFQNYALYPHMTIYDNMAYGLKFRKIPKKEIEERINDAVQILGFDETQLKRLPNQLSGGQKQRVALGRAIVRRPGIFLMDEPLSNLDAKLRVQMRNEITRVHRTVGATTIYVTHDQVEAMTMADRIVVMHEGNIQQIGTPEEIYERPANVFVAGFIGSPAMNFFDIKIENQQFVLSEEVKINIPKENLDDYQHLDGQEAILGIRPEDCYFGDEELSKKYQDAYIKGIADNVELLGYDSIVYLNKNGLKLAAKTVSREIKEQRDKEISIYLDMARVHIFDKQTTSRVTKKEESTQ